MNNKKLAVGLVFTGIWLGMIIAVYLYTSNLEVPVTKTNVANNSAMNSQIEDKHDKTAVHPVTFLDLMRTGERVHKEQCAACHDINGIGIPGVFPPIVGSKIATGDVTKHIDIVVNGKPGTAMAAFKHQLSRAEIAAVVTYQRNAFGNNTGDLVQPDEVSAGLSENNTRFFIKRDKTHVETENTSEK